MTWKQHITSAEAKARRKMNIMRKLAGTKWGANENILKSVYYHGFTFPSLTYWWYVCNIFHTLYWC
jgi:hypothetical protein